MVFSMAWRTENVTPYILPFFLIGDNKRRYFFLVIYTHLLHATQMTDRHDIVLEGLFAAF